MLLLLFVARKLPSLESRDLNQGRLGNFTFQQAVLRLRLRMKIIS